MEMQNELLGIVQHTTYYISNISTLNDTKQSKQTALVELMHTLFEQFRQVGHAHSVLLNILSQGSQSHKLNIKLYDMNNFWAQVQAVVS